MGNRLIMVGNGAAGGVGKTTLIQLLAEMHHRAGSKLTVVVADNKGLLPDGGVDLADILPNHDVVFLGAGPDWNTVEEDPDKLNTHWDKLADLVKKRSVLLDLGANVPGLFAAYAQKMRLATRWAKAGVAVEAWVPFNNSEANFSAALESLETIGKAFGTSALIAVQNEMHGPFTAWAGSPQDVTLRAFEASGTRVVTMPKCSAPASGMDAIKRGRIGYFHVGAAEEEDVAKLLGLKDGNVAVRTQFAVQDWLTDCYTAFVGLIPEKPAGN